MQELRTFTEARENDISNPVNIRKRRNNFYKDLKLDLKKKTNLGMINCNVYNLKVLAE